MIRLLLGTANPGKLRELRRLLTSLPLSIVTPADVGLAAFDVDETGATMAANAVLKARAFAAAGGLPALADDSGLEVDALDGFPGVVSARWMPGTDADRVTGLLARLAGIPQAQRTARYRAVVALARPDGTLVTAAGTVEGRIGAAPRGAGGFGYDPVFLVVDGGYDGGVTMAELPSGEKDRLSHRGRAIQSLWPALLALAG